MPNINGIAYAQRNIDSAVITTRKDVDLIKLFRSIGISYNDALHALEELENVYKLEDIAHGQKVKVHFEMLDTEGKNINLLSVTIKISQDQQVRVTKVTDDIFFSHLLESNTQTKLAFVSTTIEKNLFTSVINAGLSQETFNELVKAYSYDIDFQRDISPGNKIDVLYEGLYNNGELISTGDIMYASLTTRKGEFKIYSYTTKNGGAEFYNENGVSTRKSFLKTPVNGARISSKYGKRKHPVLGYTKFHKGIDFAAPKGTPVYASADGVILEARRKGSYGKYIRIYHNSTYSTAYAHLNGYAKGIRKGKRVKQGQVIGYVGTTGRSTGPHLHYEVLRHNKHINPIQVKFKMAKKLNGREKKLFFQYKSKLLKTINQMHNKYAQR